MSEPPVWRPEEEAFLIRLRASCEELGKVFLKMHKHISSVYARFRLPAIVLSSVSGVASFGTTTFPKNAQQWVSIVVGGVNIFIAILNTVEAFWKLGDILAKSLTCQMTLKKLADDITCELSIPIEDRTTAGSVFLRDMYARYQQAIEQAPPLEKHHILKLPQAITYSDKGQMTDPVVVQVGIEPSRSAVSIYTSRSKSLFDMLTNR